MRRLLVDTSALVALGDRGEDRHGAAVATLRAEAQSRLYLTDHLADETLTLLGLRAGAAAAARFAARVRDPRAFELLFVEADLFWRAEERFRKLADQRVSFTDCTSFVVIDHLGLDAAFTFDAGFRRAGYAVVPG